MPDGSERLIVTNGAERSSQSTFRYEAMEEHRPDKYRQWPAAEIIDTKAPLILSAFNHITKENGWYQTNANRSRDPKELVVGPYRNRNRKSTRLNSSH